MKKTQVQAQKRKLESNSVVQKYELEYLATTERHKTKTKDLLKTSAARGESSVPVIAMHEIRSTHMSQMRELNAKLKAYGGNFLTDKALTDSLSKAEAEAVNSYVRDANQPTGNPQPKENVPAQGKKTSATKRKAPAKAPTRKAKKVATAQNWNRSDKPAGNDTHANSEAHLSVNQTQQLSYEASTSYQSSTTDSAAYVQNNTPEAPTDSLGMSQSGQTWTDTNHPASSVHGEAVNHYQQTPSAVENGVHNDNRTYHAAPSSTHYTNSSQAIESLPASQTNPVYDTQGSNAYSLDHMHNAPPPSTHYASTSQAVENLLASQRNPIHNAAPSSTQYTSQSVEDLLASQRNPIYATQGSSTYSHEDMQSEQLHTANQQNYASGDLHSIMQELGQPYHPNNSQSHYYGGHNG